MPGFLAFHPMGALVGQECVRITAGEFTSMIYSVQYRRRTTTGGCCTTPTTQAPARLQIFLQHLHSGIPGSGCSSRRRTW